MTKSIKGQSAIYWSKHYSVAYPTLKRWFADYSEEIVFKALELGISPVKLAKARPRNWPGRKPAEWIHPETGVSLTCKEWAIKLGMNSRTLRYQLNLYGSAALIRDGRRPPFYTERSNADHRQILKAKNILLIAYKGKEMAPYQWADHYGVSLQEINQAMKIYGPKTEALHHFLSGKKQSIAC